MKIMKPLFTSITILLSVSANAATYNLENYADAVVNYQPGSGVGAPANNPMEALGAENFKPRFKNIVSLGNYGSLTLKFTDNALVASGNDKEDLWIGEVGDPDNYKVSISTDNLNWFEVGTGTTTQAFDIDGIAGVTTNMRFSFVKIDDLGDPTNTTFPSAGADIDAVAAISSVSAVPVPASAFLFAPALLGFMGLRRKAKK